MAPLVSAMISSYKNRLTDGLEYEPESAIIKIYKKILEVEFKRE
jgi:hypothetical protein